MRHCYLGLILSVLGISASAQVVVNEFCIANYSDYGLGGGWNQEYEDWVEFYNPTGAAFNISGYWLSDDATDPMKWEVPAGTSVPANGYLTILLSGTYDYDPGYLGQINTSFKITQTAGEDLVFSNTSGTILESYDFEDISPNQANHSWGRTPNGGATWAIHTNPSPGAANGGATGTAYSATPQLSQQAGYYAAAINVTITSPEAGATIYYTLDGSIPDNTDNLYSGPINISTTTPLRAIAYSTDPTVLPSFVETNTYFFGADQHSVYVMNISGNTLGDGSWGGDELTHIEFFAPGGAFVTEASGDSNEHGNDSNAYGQRGFDYVTRDALGYDYEVQMPLFHHRDRDRYERLIFKAAANDNYPFSGGGAHVRDAYVCELSILGDMHLDERATEFCIVYINGDYWGVYDVREKVDDIDFTDHYYDQPEGFVDFLKTWGGTWEEYGSGDDWYDLVAFITGNDMTNQANYDYVLTQYNTMSLIDYFILNGYVVCTDWLNWNTAWWRGRHPDGEAKRWRYALWDNDATFGHYINYTGVPSTGATADPCQIDGMGNVGGQGHIPVLNALFDNEDFFADYIQRYAALSNTTFSCDQMIAVLDSMVAVIDPEMQRQCTRWGGSYAGWQSNVQEMRDFILDRCADEIIGGIEDCYDVTAYTLTVEIDGVGEIIVGDVELSNPDVPWSGTYFGDLEIDIEAITDGNLGGCGSFAGWEITSGTGTLADENDPETTLIITSDVTLTAYFSAPSTGPVTVMTDVQPAGAGIITVNGTDQLVYPDNYSFDAGSDVSISVSENEWYVFNHWEVLNANIDPDEESLDITLNPCVSDTIIAVFDWISNFELMVDVEPAGAGTITMNAAPLASYPWSGTLLGDADYYFITTPADEWSIFDHWEIGNHTLSPDEFDLNVVLHLMQSDTLVAVYNVLDHHSITVIVEPPYSGVVQFADGYSTETMTTVELEDDVPFEFTATPIEYWNLEKWDSYFNVVNPNDQDKTVYIEFNENDTVIAYFEREPFAYYVPNSFTPNGDGVNDIFRPEGNAIDPSQYELLIFNRWGETVFRTTELNKPWDGSHQDGEYYVEDEIYIYRLKIKSVFEADPIELSGSITVFR